MTTNATATAKVAGKNLQTIDLVKLQKIVARCFELSLDAQIPLSSRLDFNRLGNRLNSDLHTLASAYFDRVTQQYQDASKKLNEVNDGISKDADTLVNDVQVINNLTTLAESLDNLLQIAAKFA
jgi:hypothetical protein